MYVAGYYTQLYSRDLDGGKNGLQGGQYGGIELSPDTGQLLQQIQTCSNIIIHTTSIFYTCPQNFCEWHLNFYSFKKFTGQIKFFI